MQRYTIKPATLDGLPWDLETQLSRIEGCTFVDTTTFRRMVVEVTSTDILDRIRAVFGTVQCEIKEDIQFDPE